MRTDLAASTSVVNILQELLVQGAQQVLSRPLGFSLALSTVPFWAVARGNWSMTQQAGP